MNSEAYKKILIRQFHAALATQGMMKQKESILLGYDVEHTTDLTIDQLKEVVASYSTQPTIRKPQIEVTPEVRAMRSELLTICNKMGIYVTNDDWSRVNAFFQDARIAGKSLNKLTFEELTALVPKMRSILTKHIKAQTEIERKKMMN
jgi:hypothetical protein